MSDDKTDIVLKLKTKVYRLMSLYEGLQETHTSMQEKMAELEKNLAEKDKQIRMLTSENEKLKLAKAFASGSDTKDAKLQISKIVREIDKCIALLNK